ncbi:MAG: BamA/TamA family outer membrane protein [bacterium]|nr:BamA/TamA family outer membrane protein [bacterium]
MTGLYKQLLPFIIIFVTVSSEFIKAQDSANTLQQKENIIPGIQYKAGSLHKFLFGEHWRSLWITEIPVEVIDINEFGGGLTPLKKGGGLQTKSLRLKGNDGNEYKFRLLDKNPVNSLPKELQESIYADVIQDQISIGMPGAALVVYPLMKETGILVPEPKLIYMPDVNELGKFRKDFGGKPGIIEINPRGGKKGVNNFEGAEKVVNGFEIFKKTEEDNDEKVDGPEFLKARLMDIFLGDRDRHAEQWQWAGYKTNGMRVWKPIPRDRDYAFGKYDGLFPWASGFFAHSLVGFSEDLPQITELTWTGRHLDRKFLNELEKPVYDSVAKFLTNKLTDEVLRNAVLKMPDGFFLKAGDELFSLLKKRRAQLNEAARDFYELNAGVVDVYGSNKKEFTEIDILNDKELEVGLYKKNKSNGIEKGERIYQRKFNSDHTSEIRLNLLDGNDNVTVTGNSDNNILLRIIGGNGKDEIINNSDQRIKFYDSDKETKLSSAKVYFNNDKISIPLNPIDKYEPSLEDRLGFYAFTPIVDYNTDDGFILGGGPNYLQHGFRAEPFKYFAELTGAYATAAKDYDIRFYGDFHKLIHRSRVQLFVKASELDFNRFYGFGNETARDEELAERNFYKTNQKDYSFEPIISVSSYKNFSINFNSVLRSSDVKINNEQFAGINNVYGTGKLTTLGIGAGFTYNNVRATINPQKGWSTNFTSTYFPKVFNNKNAFGKIKMDIINYRTFNNLTLVLKAGAEAVTGKYPFYYAASIGGLKNLRGYPRDRFSGDAVIFGQSELRLSIATINLFIPAKLGLSVISDIGRAFVKNERSSKWHSSYGGGVWLNVLNVLVLNFDAAFSPEVTRYYFTTGFTLK